MRRQGTLIALVTLAASVVLVASTATAAQAATSSVAFTTCADAPTFGCGHLKVPLDPTGAIPGTVALAIRRELVATGTATEAVVALAGGPGQAALPFANDAAQIMSAALATRDLVVFDQRGTGDSGALKCPALNFLSEPLSTVIPDCASQIGATRGLYTTDNSVADLEALRKALGYTKLVLYGTSYGTKVALRYAAEYPNNVAGLILDSTVTPNGPDIFDQSSYAAVPRILEQICASGACPGIAHPLADLVKVLSRLSHGPVKATYVDGAGKAIPLKIYADELAAILLAGDEDPSLRADFPAAVAAAAGGHYALLAILVAHAVLGSVSNTTVDNPLFFDTVCEELPYPWPRSAPAERIAAAIAAAQALPAGTFGPFSYRDRLPPELGRRLRLLAVPERGSRDDAHRAAERPDADHQRRGRSAHADRERSGGGGADPRRDGRRRAADRPLGADDRVRLVRQGCGQRVLRRDRDQDHLPVTLGAGLPAAGAGRRPARCGACVRSAAPTASPGARRRRSS